MQGEFSNDENDIHMTITEGRGNKFRDIVWLKLISPIHSLNNAAMDFWIKLVKMFKKLGHMRILADPCSCYSLKPASVISWLSWIDDYLHAGKQDENDDTKQKCMKELDCEDSGN